MKQRHGRSLERGERQLGRRARLLEARERQQAAERERERRDERIGVDERQQQVAPQQVRPPVGLRVEGEHEGEVGQQQCPGRERDRERRSTEPCRERAGGQDQAEAPERHVVAAQRVPGGQAGPAPRRGPHQVGAEVVADREARDTGDLGRVARHELVGQADVERGVGRDERVEQELAGRTIDAVPRVLADGEHGQERERRRDRSAQRRPGGESQGPAPEEKGPGERRGEQRREEDGWACSQAEPVGRGAPGGPERDDEGRVDVEPQRPHEGGSGQQNGQGGEGQEDEEVDTVQEFTRPRRAWYSLPLIEERKEESREVSR